MDRSPSSSAPSVPQSRRSQRKPKPNPVDTYPLCYGIVVALKNDYGFICPIPDPVAGNSNAEHVFFHASEVAAPKDASKQPLQLFDAVQFRHGPSRKDPTQTVAYRVAPINLTEDVLSHHPYGDAPCFEGRVQSTAGTIRIVRMIGMEEGNERDGTKDRDTTTSYPTTVRYDDDDRKNPIANLPPGQSRLQTGDVVQLRIVYDHRTLRALQEHYQQQQQQPNSHRSQKLTSFVAFAADLKYLRAPEKPRRIATAVTGLVQSLPQQRGRPGRLALLPPIPIHSDSADAAAATTTTLKESSSLTTVEWHREDARGSGGVVPQPGDLVLFNVEWRPDDDEKGKNGGGSYRAVPTTHVLPHDAAEQANEETDPPSAAAAIRILQLNAAGRAEGVVSALKDSFGFIQYADRPVDVHFKFPAAVLPDALQDDLRRYAAHQNDDAPVDAVSSWPLQVGASVQFDLSVPKTKFPAAASGGRENLTAARICVVPPVALVTTLAGSVGGRITQQDATQPYCGTVELTPALLPPDDMRRYPRVVSMLETYWQRVRVNPEILPLVYPHVQSVKDIKVVTELVESMGPGKLTYSYIMEDGDVPPGRLMIQATAAAEEAKAESTKVENNDEAPRSTPEPRRILRYDRKSHAADMGDLPRLGDAVVCDVCWKRRTGLLQIVNLRKEEEGTTAAAAEEGTVTETSVSGTIKELTPHFGLISLSDKTTTTTNNEVLYFAMRPEYRGGGASDANEYKFRKGDVVRFDIATAANGQRVACHLSNPRGALGMGLVLREPSKQRPTAAKPLRKSSSALSDSKKNSRWDPVEDDRVQSPPAEESPTGVILVTVDPRGLRPWEDERAAAETDLASTEIEEPHVRYKTSSLATHPATQFAAALVPHRGDLVSFVPSSKGGGIREVRLVTRGAATLRRGRWLLPSNDASAQFVCDTDGERYNVLLSEVMSGDPALKDQERVEGIHYQGKMYGIARVSDLYVESKYTTAGASGPHKERPKLNLTVKKDLGGTIVAQSMMAKGPDGTQGFAPGWTKRQSRFAATELKVDAPEFTPMARMANATTTAPVTPVNDTTNDDDDDDKATTN